MFKKNKRKKKSALIDTLIGQHTHIKGEISFSGGLRVDGSVTGNINTTSDIDSVLILGEQGSIKGEIKVPNLIINGSITGDVYASEHVELAPKAKIQGDVYYNMLEIEGGSEVNGQLIHVTKSNKQTLNLEHEIMEGEEVEYEIMEEEKVDHEIMEEEKVDHEIMEEEKEELP